MEPIQCCHLSSAPKIRTYIQCGTQIDSYEVLSVSYAFRDANKPSIRSVTFLELCLRLFGDSVFELRSLYRTVHDRKCFGVVPAVRYLSQGHGCAPRLGRMPGMERRESNMKLCTDS